MLLRLVWLLFFENHVQLFIMALCKCMQTVLDVLAALLKSDDFLQDAVLLMAFADA